MNNMEPQEDKYYGRERRDAPRIKGITAVYSPAEKDGLETVGFVKNISAKGIKLSVTKEIEKDTVLFLKMNLPGSSIPIQFKGKIVWSREADIDSRSKIMGHELGIKFIEISDNDSRKISRYVSNCFSENRP